MIDPEFRIWRFRILVVDTRALCRPGRGDFFGQRRGSFLSTNEHVPQGCHPCHQRTVCLRARYKEVIGLFVKPISTNIFFTPKKLGKTKRVRRDSRTPDTTYSSHGRNIRYRASPPKKKKTPTTQSTYLQDLFLQSDRYFQF